MTDPRKQNPLVLPNFPYKNRFTPEQYRDAEDRRTRLIDILMDPVGPDGTLINLPMDMLHILAFHLAFAGADVHTDGRQLIESRTRQDDTGMFEVSEWRPRGDFGDQWPATVEAAEAEAEAKVLAAQMRAQLTPEIRASLATILREEYEAANPEQSRRDRAENVLTESRELRGN